MINLNHQLSIAVFLFVRLLQILACTYRSILVPRACDPSGLRQESRALGATISGMRHRCRLRETGWAEFSYFLCYFKMVAPTALDSCRRPEGSLALGTRMLEILNGTQSAGAHAHQIYFIANLHITETRSILLLTKYDKNDRMSKILVFQLTIENQAKHCED